MDVNLTPDQEAFVREGIVSGRFQNAEDAVRQALAMWEERERTRAELLAQLDHAEKSLAQVHGREITRESMRRLADDIKRTGRARLATQKLR